MSRARDSENGLEKVLLKNHQGDTAEIYLHGAHLTSWKVNSREVIFTSKKAIFKPPKAIRGGIPVCFPQFGGYGALQQHGFARNNEFKVEKLEEDSAILLLVYKGSEADFPGSFELRVKFHLGSGVLSQRLLFKNTDYLTIQFTCALHTYFAVSSIDNVKIEGLSGTEYVDSLKEKHKFEEAQDPVKIDQEVDRIYVGAKNDLKIIDDDGSGYQVHIKKVGFPDAVLWNPWIEKAKGMADFGDDEYKGMLCIEPAIAVSGPISVEGGKEWEAEQIIEVVLSKS